MDFGLKNIVNVGLSIAGAIVGVIVITPILSEGFTATGFEAGIIVAVVGFGALAGDFISDRLVEKD